MGVKGKIMEFMVWHELMLAKELKDWEGKCGRV